MNNFPVESSPIVSMIIPVYQGEAFIIEALRSVTVQTFRNIEIVAINDGSTDATQELLMEYARQEPRLHIINLPTNVGVHRARAHGVMAARGKILGFLDGDDWIHPEAIERMVSALEENDADIVVCSVQFSALDGGLGAHKVKFTHEEVVDTEILRRFCTLSFGTGSLWNKFYRREVLESFAIHDFGEIVPINEDYIVNFGAFFAAKRVCLLPDSLYFYRQHSYSVTASADRARAFVRMLRAYVLCLEAYSHHGVEIKKLIDLLYATQLRFDVYQVEDCNELDEFTDHIAESLRRLADIHPTAVYNLCHLFDVPHYKSQVTQKFKIISLMRSAYRRIQSFFRG